MKPLRLLVSNDATPGAVRAMAAELGFPDEQTGEALALYDRGIPPLVSTKVIPFLFGVSPKFIGAMRERSDKYYRQFELEKRSGGTRLIQTPRRFLKVIQVWILAHILQSTQFPEYVTGFVIGRNIFDNARRHVGANWILSVDIQDFFPSIRRDQVEKWFAESGFPADVAAQLSGLVTLDGVLPQGAPTSPALSNQIFLELDRALEETSSRWGESVVYSRYADDLTFSGESEFSQEHIDAVEELLVEAGYSLNHEKTRIRGPGDRKMVTGLVVNETAQPPREKRNRWRAMFHQASERPDEFVGKIDTLRGIAGFVNLYDASTAAEYRNIIDRIPTE